MALTDQLVGYWKLDESSGNPVDSVGSRTLTNNATVTFSSGKVNNGANFNGTTQYFSRAAETIGVTNTWSVSCWFKVNATGAQEYLVRWRPAGGGDNNEIRFQKSELDKFKMVVIHELGTASGYKDYSGATTLSTGVWYHAVATWDATLLKMYLNAAEDTPYTKTVDTLPVQTNDANRILGVGGWNAVVFGNESMDEVGYWSRALTGAEVTELYNAGSGLGYPFTPGNSKFLQFM